MPRDVTKQNFFLILVYLTEIILYLPFSDWFWTKRNSFWFQINRKMVNTIGFRSIQREPENISLRQFLGIECPRAQHLGKFCNRNDTFWRVIGILVNWPISTVYFDEDSSNYSRLNTSVGMCQSTRIPMPRIKVSFCCRIILSVITL